MDTSVLGVVDRVPLIPSVRSGNLDQDCRSQRGHEFDNRLVNISYRLGETRTRSLGPCVILCHRKLLARELLDCGDRGNLGDRDHAFLEGWYRFVSADAIVQDERANSTSAVSLRGGASIDDVLKLKIPQYQNLVTRSRIQQDTTYRTRNASTGCVRSTDPKVV